jgi:hypothetical protein
MTGLACRIGTWSRRGRALLFVAALGLPWGCAGISKRSEQVTHEATDGAVRSLLEQAEDPAQRDRLARALGDLSSRASRDAAVGVLEAFLITAEDPVRRQRLRSALEAVGHATAQGATSAVEDQLPWARATPYALGALGALISIAAVRSLFRA